MRPPATHRPLTFPSPRTLARSGAARTRAGLSRAWTRATVAVGHAGRSRDDRGATAIEWAIFAGLAVVAAGAVAAVITLAVNNRLPVIQ